MRNRRIEQETGRVLFAGATVWATVIAAAAVEGVADKFGDATLESFGAAMAVFAFACYRIDTELRTFARGVGLRSLTFAAVAGSAITLAALAAHAITFAVFAAPLAALALAARLDRHAPRGAATKAPAKSPGARQAAT
jgi:phosphoribosylcarboxyaminoimidazole (NCAIR) mutase